MAISVTLNDEQSRQLEDLSRRLNVAPQELAIAAINDLLARPANDFDQAARYVLEKNRELYRRLS
ncbi:MAG: DNA-binding protein [Maioricimonas sp. JB045]|uniref:DNA-binding protein n=1 Tax=Maioricimonas sp. JC845 TaxID=3232138 RepID=UPI00345819C6